ncbi:MAG TPA: hypothetical protein VM536_00825, partial [Chloroflexia bacterium]|nr:hypothetical protein [Chloroflexia bacterium]
MEPGARKAIDLGWLGRWSTETGLELFETPGATRAARLVDGAITVIIDGALYAPGAPAGPAAADWVLGAYREAGEAFLTRVEG